MAVIKSKLHASQVYIPKNFLEKLAIDKNAEIFLEFDEKSNAIIITAKKPESDPLKWILEATKNPPKTLGGNELEDLKEYDFDDV
ncbi:MAG: AbrB/MazE/SpoVT family DNA-binding domain-containing protein [Candidatus Sigynarchaeum springense]